MVNVALISLDSLRYDVATTTPTPNLDRVFSSSNAGTWRRCYSQGTYTLPSHVSLFQVGFLPDNRNLHEPIYNRAVMGAFRIQDSIHGARSALYDLQPAPNLIKAFSRKGFSTLGVGGVGWFDTRLPTSRMWQREYFDDFSWKQSFHESCADSFKNQIETLKEAIPSKTLPLLLFLNIASTHSPFCGDPQGGPAAQGRALRYVDNMMPLLFECLPLPCHVFMFGDHGECFGED